MKQWYTKSEQNLYIYMIEENAKKHIRVHKIKKILTLLLLLYTCIYKN